MTISTTQQPALTQKHVVKQEIEVEAPISTVYDLWTQFEKFPEFMKAVQHIEHVDEHQMKWTVSIAGVKRSFITETTQQTPDELVAWQSVDGKTHAGVVKFVSVEPDRTHITVHLGWTPENVADLAGMVLQLDDIQVKQDLKNFKEMVEEGNHVHSAGDSHVTIAGDIPTDGETIVNDRNINNDNKRYENGGIVASQFIEPNLDDNKPAQPSAAEAGTPNDSAVSQQQVEESRWQDEGGVEPPRSTGLFNTQDPDVERRT